MRNCPRKRDFLLENRVST